MYLKLKLSALLFCATVALAGHIYFMGVDAGRSIEQAAYGEDFVTTLDNAVKANRGGKVKPDPKALSKLMAGL